MKESIVSFGDKVGHQVNRSVHAVANRDVVEAQRVIKRDLHLDEAEVDI